ncbi:12134_t:CDS:2 [Ambispora leptoticha]|uniref:12134_t:CDS:1 n=1 Tax=Ambispora leptoticha TaxID=144679 RepID=A0A9N9C2T6_9GLOM|nr:12134_t:CDS:2 [Ambispora leptoticha]
MTQSPFPDNFDPYSPRIVSSIDLLIFIYFSIAFIIIAYPLYRIVAGAFNWELTTKTPAKHYGDLMALFRYGLIVFVLGGYSGTFNWISILSFYIAMYSYGLIAQIPFAQTSLPRWRTWPLAMWILFIAAFAIILAFAGFHIYLADSYEIMNEPRKHNTEFVAWYLGCLIIPAILATVALMFQKVQNDYDYNKIEDGIFTKIFGCMTRKKAQNVNDNSTNEQHTITVQGETATATSPPGPKIKARVHLHHWQIFYVLAFFTRFEHPVSRVASGIVLGIYTQGMTAYGPDSFLEEYSE